MPLSTALLALSIAWMGCWGGKEQRHKEGRAFSEQYLLPPAEAEQAAVIDTHTGPPKPQATYVRAALGHGCDLVLELAEEAAAARGQQALALRGLVGRGERRDEGEEGGHGKHDAHGW